MLHRLPAWELRRLIGAKCISPTELMRHYQARIAQINPTLNAFVTLDWDRAFEEAKRLDQSIMKGERLEILHGLPVAVKDLTRTRNMRTTFGSSLFADHVPEQDEIRIASVKSNGGIIVGKTNTPEFGAGANTFNSLFGPTLNPFDIRLSVAGSSGGSAAALSAGLVPLATGSDMGGSLRTPASFCGVVGFRPSPGIVPAENSRLAWSPLMVEGPMACNVRDVSLLLAGMSSQSELDPLSRPIEKEQFTELRPADLSTLRIALSEDLGFANVAKAERAAFGLKMGALEGHCGSVSWAEPDLGDADFVFETIRAVHFIDAFSVYDHHQISVMSENIRTNLEEAKKISARDVALAYSEQTKAWHRAQRFFSHFDALITPAAAVSPFAVDEIYPRFIDGIEMRNYIQWFALGFGISIIAHPVVCLPCGLGSTGMPFGIQIVAPFGKDQRALSIGLALEELFTSRDELKRPVPSFAN
jgi:amidase